MISLIKRTKYYALMEKYLFPKAKFAVTSGIATAVDYCLYLLLVYLVLPAVISNIISSSVGMLINFYLQKKFVFLLKRKTLYAFLLSVSFSLIGISLGTFFIYLLNKFSFFETHQYITKIIVVGIIFFYNYYTKKFAFEKQLKQLLDR